MKAAVLYGKEDVRIEDIPTPEANESEVLVKVETALTCGTDVKVFKRGYHARMIKPPSVFGHEFSGVVVEAGKNVQEWLNKRVVAANSAPCDTCFYCGIGRQSLCEDIQWLNGAYAEFIKVPGRIVEKNLLEIPIHVSFNEAALVEPLACVVHGMEESNIKENDTVVINGSGPIGLMFVVLAKLMNAKVVVCDASEDRLRTARKLGADETVNINEVDQVQTIMEFTKHGADVAIEAVGLPEVWEKTISMVRKGGTVNLFGGCPSGTSIRIDTKTIHYDEVTLKGVFHHTPKHVRQALQLITEKKIDATKLISKEMSLENLVEALREMMTQEVIKIAIKP